MVGRVTLIELLEHSAAEHGPQPALISSGGPQLTHQELHAAIDNTASQLRRIGVKPGQLVSLAFPNTLESASHRRSLERSLHRRRVQILPRRRGFNPAARPGSRSSSDHTEAPHRWSALGEGKLRQRGDCSYAKGTPRTRPGVSGWSWSEARGGRRSTLSSHIRHHEQAKGSATHTEESRFFNQEHHRHIRANPHRSHTDHDAVVSRSRINGSSSLNFSFRRSSGPTLRWPLLSVYILVRHQRQQSDMVHCSSHHSPDPFEGSQE